MRNYLVFGGKDSRDFGVYISGQGTFNAPEKAYTFYPIPGRNGALIGNERRLENVELSYDCFIYSDFDKNIADFRTYLLSLDGYQDLTDSYHPDEIRKACFVGPLEVSPTRKNKAGSFTLTFNCKPQRYLVSGNTKYYWTSLGNQTITGASLSIPNAAFLDPSVLTSEFHVRDKSHVALDRDPMTVFSREEVVRLMANGTAVATARATSSNYIAGGTIDWINGTGEITEYAFPLSSTSSWQMEDSTHFSISFPNFSDLLATIERNLVLPFESVTFDANAHKLIAEAHGPYASLADFIAGVAYYPQPVMGVVLAAITPETMDVTSWTLPATGTLELSFYGGNPPPSTCTVTVESVQNDGMANPTLFPSEPLIRVTGNGSFVMDGVTVTVNTPGTYTDIDCELMDCYEGSTNRNDKVTFSTYDFPKLRPGENSITLGAGITSVEIWPRWWRV